MKFKSNARYSEPAESGTIFEGKIGNIRMSVYRIVPYESWYLSCSILGITQKGLNSDTITEAIKESKEVLKNVIEDFRKDIDSFCESEIEISRY